jgi:predicted enzyme related to lactoylglutathione lyase
VIKKNLSVAVMVSDAKKSAQWFKENLGFNSSIEEHWITVWPRGCTSKVHLCQGELEPGNTGIAFYCDDVLKVSKMLKSRKVKFSKDVTKEDWGTYAMIDDPDGNVFWLMQGSP